MTGHTVSTLLGSAVRRVVVRRERSAARTFIHARTRLTRGLQPRSRSLNVGLVHGYRRLAAWAHCWIAGVGTPILTRASRPVEVHIRSRRVREPVCWRGRVHLRRRRCSAEQCAVSSTFCTTDCGGGGAGAGSIGTGTGTGVGFWLARLASCASKFAFLSANSATLFLRSLHPFFITCKTSSSPSKSTVDTTETCCTLNDDGSSIVPSGVSGDRRPPDGEVRFDAAGILTHRTLRE